MKKKNNNDLVDVFSAFQNTVLKNKPSHQDMWTEVRMMKFQIRPLNGDVSMLNLKNHNLIEIIWRLGKLDEFFQSQFKHLSPGQKNVFFNMFDDLHEQFQEQLNTINLKKEYTKADIPPIEMEIFKEQTPPNKIN